MDKTFVNTAIYLGITSREDQIQNKTASDKSLKAVIKIQNRSNIKTISRYKKSDEKIWSQPLTEDIVLQEIINLKVN